MRVIWRRSKRGGRLAAFTLIELMVVIVILGILATLIMPRILDRPEQARREKARIQIVNFRSSLGLFKIDTGDFPTTSERLQALVADPGVKGWKKGGYLEQAKVPLDPWGKRYIYLCPGRDGRDYDLISHGKDGEPGGSGNDADIESWNLDQE